MCRILAEGYYKKNLRNRAELRTQTHLNKLHIIHTAFRGTALFVIIPGRHIKLKRDVGTGYMFGTLVS